MRLGIMQPYFFPYLGYFSLMKHTDRWIFFDTPQYIRKGWVNRNRVLKKNGGVKYIGISVNKHSRETPINEITISNPHQIHEDLVRNLDYYKDHNAPFYGETVDFIEKCVGSFSGELLADLLTHSLTMTCQYLGLTLKAESFSGMAIRREVENIAKCPGDWALAISRSLGASHYINPPGGREIFSREKFDAHGIKLSFLKPELREYPQSNDGQDFVSALSIIDALMFNSPESISTMLDNYTLEQ